MLARAGGGQAFVPQPPVPSPCFSSPPATYDLPPTVFTIHHSPFGIAAPLVFLPHLPPTTSHPPYSPITNHQSQITNQTRPSPSACHLKPDTWNLHFGILNPVSSTTPPTTLAYLLPPVKRRNVHAAPVLLWHARRCRAHAARQRALSGM
jgi:hypothetical protein